MKDNGYIFITGTITGTLAGCSKELFFTLTAGFLSGATAIAGKEAYLFIKKNRKSIISQISKMLKIGNHK